MIEALANGFQAACLYLGLIAIAAVCIAVTWLNIRRLSRSARGKVKGVHLAALALLGVVFALYGGRKGRITFPYTDFEQRYIVDSGSYVASNIVHVAFSRYVVPASADFFIAFRHVDSTNDLDWAVFTNTTFSAFTVPCDIEYPAATNFDWVCYTTWTPGPTVQTNGVWHSYWGMDKKLHTHFIPIRSAVRVDGETIATPKSKREANQ